MKRFSLLVHSPDCDGFWKKGRYACTKSAKKAYRDAKIALNLDKAKVIDNLTKEVNLIS